MYKNVGNELKEYSRKYVAIRTLISFAVVFVAGFLVSYIDSSNSDLMWIWLILLVAVPISTYYRAKLQAMQQYAFGELVESVVQIRDMMSEKMWENTQH